MISETTHHLRVTSSKVWPDGLIETGWIGWVPLGTDVTQYVLKVHGFEGSHYRTVSRDEFGGHVIKVLDATWNIEIETEVCRKVTSSKQPKYRRRSI